jgi:carbonic anhydrase
LPLAIFVVHSQLACGSTPPAAPAGVPAPHAKWSYSGDNGPEHWGDLDPGYALCKTGDAQSPIDLPPAPARHQPSPGKPHWEPVPLRITNNGHTIQVDDTSPSSFVVEGVTYKLAQFHFHCPSEHTVGGRAFDAEAHFVHKSETGKVLVVALLFGSGAENPVLAPVWRAMPAKEGPTVTVPDTTIDVSSLLPGAPRYFRYDGSLTTPPCTEGVKWLVVEPDASTQLSPDQIKKLRGLTLPSTNRPEQRVGSREVPELVP